MKNYRLRDASGWTMFIFGVLALLMGMVGLISPETILRLLGFEIVERSARTIGDYTIGFVIASSMASFNMGVYYIFAALNDVRQFYQWTVPFRMVTFVAFTIAVLTGLAAPKFEGVAIWELTGAIATGIALAYDKRKSGA
jgi:hypothetical protein